MFLIKPLLVFLGSLSLAAGFDVPGGWERLMFYHAYLIDCQTHDNKPTTMAPKIKGSKDLNEFIRFIDNVPPETPVAVTKTRFPDLPPLEETAKNIIASGYTTPVAVGRVNTKVTSSNYDILIVRTGEFIYGQVELGRVDEKLVTATRKVISAVNVLRRQAAAKSFFEKAENAKYKPVYKERPLWAGSDTKALVMDGLSTAKANNMESKELYKIFREHLGDGHSNNIHALTDLSERLEALELKKTC
ncbi:hypothetical protein L249_6192 [Ophiocordyceps polyrhachis-furcata BCC 54312]|uniref:Uncharacterized protein n=1 Tax=Ophiocordyceps polyrhachis-furcata BCC 54312 TaxID=1330021 RepID=A0A367LIM2_9HYPO|nr:hypothetical protein L249_6192 [Ophiocordyceps polyrhachis-furcata BCC 54312]